jgi:nucleoside-diphosphate-sugar epimerase
MKDILKEEDIIVVAGAGGFIGGHMVQRLLDEGYKNIRAVDNKPIGHWYQRPAGVEYFQEDLKLLESCRKVLEDSAAVFNFAADMGGMGFIEYHKADCMLSVLINTHLLIAAREFGVKRLFYASSACVYNADKQKTTDVIALKEEDAYPAMPEDGYGWEKLFSERMCNHFDEEFGIKTRVARYHNVYGPNGTWDGGREKAPAAISRKIAQAKITGNHEITIWGDGLQTRSFMYIDDCIEGTLKIFQSDCNEPLNLGSDRLISVNDLVSIIESIAGIKVRRNYNLAAPKGVRGRNSDNTRLQNTINWVPKVSLEEGLEKTYEWIYNQLLSGKHDISSR